MQKQVARIKRVNQIKQQIKDIDSGKMPNSALLRGNMRMPGNRGIVNNLHPANQNRAQAGNISSDWVILDPDELGYGMGNNARRWIKTGGCDFGKSLTYKMDSDLQHVKDLLASYNHDGMTYQQEIDLMKAASAYIAKYSTGKKASHKKRTELMENILYQLTMQGGTKDTADRNISRAKTKQPVGRLGMTRTQNLSYVKGNQEEIDKINAEKYPDDDFPQRYEAAINDTLDDLKGLYSDNKYSKSLQMIAADVMSRSGNLTEIKGMGGSGFRDTNKGYFIDIREQIDKFGGDRNKIREDALDTGFHEFTHLANAQAFGNVNGMAFSQEESDEDVWKIAKGNHDKFKKLNDLGGDPADYNYATGWQNHSKYSDGLKNSLDYYRGRNEITEATYNDKMAKANKILRIFGPKSAQQYGKYKHYGTHTMVEYDAVVNQLLARYENQGRSRDSQYYRVLKSAAIDSHVRRRTAELMKKMRGGQ